MHSFRDWYSKAMRDADKNLIVMDDGRKADMQTAYEAGTLAERNRMQEERDYAVRWANKAVDDVKASFPGALWDIRAERQRQVDEEGWTAEHDDAHTDGSLALAASCYADPAPELESVGWPHELRPAPKRWPLSWRKGWWKPTDRRRDLVKAGALIVAEIERIDRAAAHAASDIEAERIIISACSRLRIWLTLRTWPRRKGSMAILRGLTDMSTSPDITKAAEELADSILKAAGSGLRHYTVQKTRDEIIGAAVKGLEAEREKCARIAANFLGAGIIAAAIRKGGE